ncbi:NAD-dependent epimerase/dehydratase family protein [Sphingomonas sabuli]|uniref:NAD-dependent epimerase/dehydratase family protein n=1 Tax=Sphingomonas sabuli TaxID=2764186 RepID=A0A7G9L598_9SPHN|nr:NAD-dependent epimerase/dehydratase family protein [Sphingomonas sabuli]QNM83797.1 NAD-dependent epimerase/dehydratase family protein [Sphingomonas sabuli]
MARTVLISGGAGFIGTHVARLAAASGHNVRLLDNLSGQVHGDSAAYRPPDGVELFRGDVTERGDWERALADVDAVVHLAAETGTAQSMYEIDRYYRTNVQGTAVLFDILAGGSHAVGNVILASSRSVYGEGAYVCRNCDPDGARRFPQSRTREQLEAKDWEPKCPKCGEGVEPVATAEDDALSPASIYAATKLAQEDIVRIACASAGIAHTVLRLQNVYGEGQSLRNPYTGILSIFSTRVRLGLPLPIYEDGAESRDFVHVDDVAATILRCIDHPQAGATINVGSGVGVSVMEVATLLARTLGAAEDPFISGEYRLGDIRHNFADIGRLKALTGLAPSVALEDGIARFCQWVRTQPIPEDLLDKANAELKSRNLMG